ncbi:protein neprosin-like [Phragmites australis]|uniref:protein neprosin-like n=1 Tax=Phragmites australis TaxID=29695 RepID=UPI002D78A19D|nr:protein neprosin-like [Phragmites australis]
MDVYGLELKHGQWSSTSVWVTHNGDGSKSSYNSVIVGWHIYPELYGDSRPRFHTYWTRDGYQATGCFNMDCPGFIAADGAMVAPGAVISPVSDAKNGHLQNITLKVFKDKTSGDWWIYYGFNSVPTAVGYYPKSLFTSMAENANQIKFGAFAASARTLPSPPIGNGVLPYSGQGRAASFTNLSLVDQDGRNNPIMDDLPTVVSNSQCYSVTPIAYASFFYGGPGSCI